MFAKQLIARGNREDDARGSALLAFLIALSFISPVRGAESETVMIIAPHPDDGEIFCGGTILWHKSGGAKIVEVFVTSGGASSIDPEGRKGRELETAREKEAIMVTEAFGIDYVEFLRFPDGSVNANETTERAIRGAVERHKPSIIYAPEFRDPFYKHTDHVATGAVVDRIAQNVRFYDYAPRPGRDTVYLDVTEFIEEKNKLIYGYESQEPIIEQTTRLLPAIYFLNGFLAGKPGRLCEGFREKQAMDGP